MSGCCEGGCALEGLRDRQRGTLRWVLGINALMFGVIVGAGVYGDSTALLADSLDNLGDALTYALSLYAVSRGAVAKARVALFKGAVILIGALVVAGQVIHRLLVPSLPIFEVMGLFSLLGLAANALCLALLWRHRHDDLNMSSVWECSRNDIASNLAVLLASGLVWLTNAGWPDILVALGLAALLLRSASRVITAAVRELRNPRVGTRVPFPSGSP